MRPHPALDLALVSQAGNERVLGNGVGDELGEMPFGHFTAISPFPDTPRKSPDSMDGGVSFLFSPLCSPSRAPRWCRRLIPLRALLSIIRASKNNFGRVLKALVMARTRVPEAVPRQFTGKVVLRPDPAWFGQPIEEQAAATTRLRAIARGENEEQKAGKGGDTS